MKTAALLVAVGVAWWTLALAAVTDAAPTALAYVALALSAGAVVGGLVCFLRAARRLPYEDS